MHISIFVFGPKITKHWIYSLCNHFDIRSYNKRDKHSIKQVSEIVRYIKRK